jgi:MFS family permease
MLRIVGSASAALTVTMLPVFLVGALSGELGRDLGFSEAEVGAALTLLFIVASIAATPVGRLTERIGATWALRTGVTCAAVILFGVGAWAGTWWQLALPLAAVGVAIGLVDTGAARAFADHLTTVEQGRAFGLKEASVPAAALLAGLAVPAMAAPFGWRSTFMATVALAALVLVALARFGSRRTPSLDRPGAHPVEGDEVRVKAVSVRPSTILLAAGAGLGAGAATAAAAFMVPALAARGIATPIAGLVLSAASVASITARILAGSWADRPTSRPHVAIILLASCGSLAALALALPLGLPGVLVAAMVLLGAGWGWTGLAFLVAVRANPKAPAAAAGVTLSGLALGGALGPIAFGGLAARLSYTSAWLTTAVALVLTAALTTASLTNRT